MAGRLQGDRTREDERRLRLFHEAIPGMDRCSYKPRGGLHGGRSFTNPARKGACRQRRLSLGDRHRLPPRERGVSSSPNRPLRVSQPLDPRALLGGVQDLCPDRTSSPGRMGIPLAERRSPRTPPHGGTAGRASGSAGTSRQSHGVSRSTRKTYEIRSGQRTLGHLRTRTRTATYEHRIPGPHSAQRSEATAAR